MGNQGVMNAKGRSKVEMPMNTRATGMNRDTRQGIEGTDKCEYVDCGGIARD